VPSMCVPGLDSLAAVNRVVASHPGYSWKSLTGVVSVRTADTPAVPSWLDTRIAQFDLKDRSLLEAQHSIYRLFDPKFRGAPMPRSMAAKLSLRPGALDPVSVSLRDVSVREILNAVVRQHGGIGWVVSYRLTRVRPRPVLPF